MNNLIERLRAHEELGTSLEDEAADRIEQLEDQLSFMTKECQRFEAENERLRAALEDSDDLL